MRFFILFTRLLGFYFYFFPFLFLSVLVKKHATPNRIGFIFSSSQHRVQENCFEALHTTEQKEEALRSSL
jgi:hypothetical protein